MTKELQDLTWSVFPKEFKEEVKRDYLCLTSAYKAMLDKDTLTNPECDRCKVIREKISIYSMYFGHHNLTSDAEGEEMLTVPRKAIIQAYEKSCAKRATKYDVGYADCLYNLFGSKCLPDAPSSVPSTKSDVPSSESKDCDNPLADKEGYKWLNNGKCAFDSACYFEPLNPQEPKPAEPKYHKGEKVVVVSGEHKGYHGIVDDIDYAGNCHVFGIPEVYFEPCDLEPYTEPIEVKEGKKEKKLENSQSGQITNCDRPFLSILQDLRMWICEQNSEIERPQMGMSRMW